MSRRRFFCCSFWQHWSICASLLMSSPLVKVMEPEKCEGWEWIKWSDTENLAHNQLDVHEVDRDEPIDDGQKLFLPLVDLVKQRPRFNPENSWNDAEDLDE